MPMLVHYRVNFREVFVEGRCEVYILVNACGVVVSMFDFHRSDRGSNPGRGGEFS